MGITARTRRIAGRKIIIRQNMPDIHSGKPVGRRTPKKAAKVKSGPGIA